MEALTVAVRALHIATCVALFGEFVFFVFVAWPSLQIGGDAGKQAALRRRLVALCGWLLFAALASGGLWLAIQAASMSGEPLPRALGRETLGAVLTQTLFGNVWMARLGICLALGLIVLLARPGSTERDRLVFGACALLAGLLLASISLAGHANAERGADRFVHLTADAFHLLGAGAWLGALPPLAAALAQHREASAEDLDAAARAASRFSSLGIVSVAVLLVTGTVNAWYTVGTLTALVGTPYGQLLLVKLGLFGAMFALAGFNRTRLTPLLARNMRIRAIAAAKLRRNAVAEAILGVGILIVVGALGVSLPAIHAQH